jgi:CHAT domain-containing protein
LIEARSGIARKSTFPKLLVIGQPDEGTIPAVEQEVQRIQALAPSTDVIFKAEATKAAVLPNLQNHSWVHFACHGLRDPEPFHSSFKLHNGEQLKLLDIVQARLPDAELAFVSVCHGAAVDIKGTPDEVIHLSAALQFCGFRSVVGTLWAMADEDGPDVATDFYGHMFRDLQNVDFRDAATALNIVTKEMRKRGEGECGQRPDNALSMGELCSYRGNSIHYNTATRTPGY